MNWSRVLNMVGCHAGGEIGHVITGGVVNVPGDTVFAKKMHLQDHLDHIRKLLLFEPRGGVVHSVNVILPATDSRASYGYVIMESTEYPAMSGSNTICVATVLLETGMVPMHEPMTDLVLEAPAGLIKLRCECENGKVKSVRFVNQPAFVHALDRQVEVPGVGTVTVDVAYGGMTYALADARALGFEMVPSEARDLCVLGQQIKEAAAEQIPTSHPDNADIAGITQTLFAGPLSRDNGVLTSRNTVIVSPGRVDRSPCGTGTSARLAVLHARGQIKPGENFVHESIIGTKFDSHIEATTQVGRFDAVIPSVAGQAWITSMSQIGLDPTDPFPEGYTLSDTWLKTL
ncbi:MULTISPECIES: proline racemase family protein [Halomonas]|uniref:proline racemase family protein n=1 Tax=Halomonas TaxID=2745 RepID=UPI001C945C0D|nr:MULTISPECIES: proline racemase family protein [Halomonas]MBY6208636.1 proline racemase family protein [Halomonas sp. DP3Y7-2]MBY6227107.1 proline racemase family protein [Halomonas sp. DP3Y7-1]MCA0915144.1 proline racemase family protein [Halomonas denitrificans]